MNASNVFPLFTLLSNMVRKVLRYCKTINKDCVLSEVISPFMSVLIESEEEKLIKHPFDTTLLF